jgi:hypothetical protein
MLKVKQHQESSQDGELGNKKKAARAQNQHSSRQTCGMIFYKCSMLKSKMKLNSFIPERHLYGGVVGVRVVSI